MVLCFSQDCQEPFADGEEGGRRPREFLDLNRAKQLVDMLLEAIPLSRLSRVNKIFTLRLKSVEEERRKYLVDNELCKRIGEGLGNGGPVQWNKPTSL